MKLQWALLLVIAYSVQYAFPEKALAQDEFFASPYGKNLVLATYTGGKQAFIRFLATHIKLPDNLSISDTSKTYTDIKTDANFEIEKDGTVSAVTLSNSINPEIDKELIDAIKLSVWKPATSGKQPVRGGHFVQIYFIKK